MKCLQSFKFQLTPSGQQKRHMSRFAGSCRFVFNKALALQKEWYQSDPTIRFSYVKLANLLPSWKQEFTWMRESPSQALQHAFKDLERAYQNFFAKRTAFPKFKKKGVSDSFRYPQGVKKVQKLHHRIANIRRHFLHQTSSQISKNHAIVCIEDLQVKNMSKSAAGTTEQQGKNVRAKSGLNKSILDQGWGEFRRQLDYKLAWNGGYLIAVPPQNTSRTCPNCGHVSANNRQTQAKFACVQCGYENHADVVGAINVLTRGQVILAAA